MCSGAIVYHELSLSLSVNDHQSWSVRRIDFVAVIIFLLYCFCRRWYSFHSDEDSISDFSFNFQGFLRLPFFILSNYRLHILFVVWFISNTLVIVCPLNRSSHIDRVIVRICFVGSISKVAKMTLWNTHTHTHRMKTKSRCFIPSSWTIATQYVYHSDWLFSFWMLSDLFCSIFIFFLFLAMLAALVCIPFVAPLVLLHSSSVYEMKKTKSVRFTHTRTQMQTAAGGYEWSFKSIGFALSTMLNGDV